MKYVIFDIDGTLADTKKVEDKCFIKAFEETFGINIENQNWESFENVTDWGITEEIIKRERGYSPEKSEYDLMIHNFTRRLETEKRINPSQFSEVKGAKSFFNELRKRSDMQLGIATGAWEKSAIIKLDSIGIDLDNICFSNSNYFKSREDITQDVIQQLTSKVGQIPDRIIYFGDGEWDFKTCRNLGIDFIGIDIERDDKLKDLGAKVVFQDFTDKEEILKELSRKV